MRIFFFFLFACTLLQCKPGNSEKTVANDSEAVTLPEDFQTFYEKFHADSLYQIAHIQFPLQGYPAHANTTLAEGEAFAWQKADWIMHKDFKNENGEYDRSFQLLTDDLIVEIIKHTPSDYQMQRRYSKSGDEWMLIYYMAMNKYK